MTPSELQAQRDKLKGLSENTDKMLALLKRRQELFAETVKIAYLTKLRDALSEGDEYKKWTVYLEYECSSPDSPVGYCVLPAHLPDTAFSRFRCRYCRNLQRLLPDNKRLLERGKAS